MNTQTHLLLGLAVLSRGARGGAHADEGDAPALATPGAVNAALLVGALLPDASLFVMWGQAKLAGVPESRIWSELYYSDFWQTVGAITNAAPLFAALAALGWLAGGRLAGAAARARPLASVALASGLAALLHVATDLPLHHDDGHAHFWPFSDWVFVSPVSYWDPAHHGRLWSLIEVVLALGLIVTLWRRFAAPAARAALVLAALSYGAVTLYWVTQLGGGAAP